MNMTFLGSFYPKDRYKEILLRSKYIDFAGDTLQWNLIKGFELIGYNVNAITVPNTKKLKGCFLKDNISNINENSKCYCIGFIDIKGLKHYTTSIKVKKVIDNSLNKSKYIFIYSIQINLLRAAYLYKKKNPDTKIILLVTDLSEYMSESKALVYNVLKKIEIIIDQKYIKSIDAFILLSIHMKEKIVIKKKPYIVIEGIYNPEDNSYIKKNEIKNSKKIILYTGTLAKRYGIIDLVKAFHSIKNNKYELIILGDGDAKNEIEYYCLIDNRIKYLGVKEREQVLIFQQKADLLVNPRTPIGDYVKYSFPSKTIEYLASGTPTLMYKLPGVPDEYYDYCFTIPKIGVKPLAEAINSILKKPTDELITFGDKARNFVLNNKNQKNQCRKIADFINEL